MTKAEFDEYAKTYAVVCGDDPRRRRANWAGLRASVADWRVDFFTELEGQEPVLRAPFSLLLAYQRLSGGGDFGRNILLSGPATYLWPIMEK